jgi:2,3-dihydroxybenzoate-AMP ligase/mycobactin salicyl-AMP ligase
MPSEGFRPYPRELAKIYNCKRWWLGLTFGDILDRVADFYPKKVGIVTEDVRLSYEEFRNEVNRVAIAFSNIGLGKGDRVIIQLPNWLEFLYAFFALHKIGAIVVFALPRHSQVEIEYLAELTQAKAWIVPIKYRKTDFTSLIKFIQSKKLNLEYIITPREAIEGTILFDEVKNSVSLPLNPQGYLEKLRPDPMDMANILLTGGTTGLPKGVPRDHNSHILNGYGWVWCWELGNRDTGVTAMPLGHNAAHITVVYPMILLGGKIVLITGTGPKEILETVENERVTFLSLVPAQMEALLNFPDFSKYDVSSLRLITLGGAHSSSELINRVYGKFGDIQVANVFGMAEGPCASTRKDDYRELISTTVGLPACPYDHFKIVDEREEEVSIGVEGELVCKGPGVFTGYYKAKKKELSEIFTKDWYLKTGDLARKVNEQGYIQITGRKKDIIIRGAENISSGQVEEWVSSHPKVEAVAVVGMPDPILGERICAYIKLKKGMLLQFDELITFLKEKGASVFVMPERIELIDELPLTNIGKVDKKVLREDIKNKLKVEGKI